MKIYGNMKFYGNIKKSGILDSLSFSLYHSQFSFVYRFWEIAHNTGKCLILWLLRILTLLRHPHESTGKGQMRSECHVLAQHTAMWQHCGECTKGEGLLLHVCLLFYFKEQTNIGLGDGNVVKKAHHSWGGPEFRPQRLHQVAYNCLWVQF